jgi:methylated-DNA-[protein]-cysteine S-methyltransferase
MLPNMSETGFTLFETAIGACAIAWTRDGVCAVQLPAASKALTRRHMQRLRPGAAEKMPPPEVSDACAAIKDLLAGAPVLLSDIRLDLSGVPSFHQDVYRVTRTVKPGETITYGEIAKRLGLPGAAQAVGQALGKNPFPLIVPCHRVLAKGGKSGGFSAPGGVATKLRLLAIEGAEGMRGLFD